MTSTGEQSQRPKARKPPHYLLGLLLSGVLPGAGFSYLGQWKWHLGWFAIMAALLYLAFAQMAATSFDSTSLLTLIPIGWVLQLLHYHSAYLQESKQQFPHVTAGPSKVLLGGHMLLGIGLFATYFGIVVSNNLDMLRYDRKIAEEKVADDMFFPISVMGGNPESWPKECPKPPTDPGLPKVKACKVGQGDYGGIPVPTMDITFENGHTIHRGPEPEVKLPTSLSVPFGP